MNASQSFNESRNEIFKDPELAAMYLEECLTDGNIELFKLALKHVTDAQLGGMSNVTVHSPPLGLDRHPRGSGDPCFEVTGFPPSRE